MHETASFVVKPETSPERQAFYTRLDQIDTAPLWEVLNRLVLPAPQPAIVPAMWKYDDVRALLMEAGRLLTVQEAERRVLVLENPGIRGMSQITQSLYAGLQLIQPGENAASHRHTASALRFIVEGDGGGYTAVDGERTPMHAGDFVLTPSWTFHDHGNFGSAPVIWLDVLDLPIVNMFDTSFAEHHPQETQPVARKDGDALARYGANMLPLEYKQPRGATSPSPVFNYPYSRSRKALQQLSKNGPADPHHGFKLQYVNPASGGYPLTTIAAFLQLLPKGFASKGYRSTDSTIYNVVEGHGKSRIGSKTMTWGPRDIFVVPSWEAVSHEASEEAVLFSASDRAAQKALGLWREEAL
ncbi:MAG: gentisate 1,2-dioxygenase [Acidobacteria bacterium]|nr:MAG: gentisate 1,2-dioxygenase [Acidobacteriota bacterium]PYR77693.1 MAG: gentisate 1,2-dioxygenase [Acidobacteriota bacterium]